MAVLSQDFLRCDVTPVTAGPHVCPQAFADFFLIILLSEMPEGGALNDMMRTK